MYCTVFLEWLWLVLVHYYVHVSLFGASLPRSSTFVFKRALLLAVHLCRAWLTFVFWRPFACHLHGFCRVRVVQYCDKNGIEIHLICTRKNKKTSGIDAFVQLKYTPVNCGSRSNMTDVCPVKKKHKKQQLPWSSCNSSFKRELPCSCIQPWAAGLDSCGCKTTKNLCNKKKRKKINLWNQAFCSFGS